MYELGDTLLCGVIVGVVQSVEGKAITCACSDGKIHTYNTEECTLISKYKTTLELFEGGIRRNAR